MKPTIYLFTLVVSTAFVLTFTELASTTKWPFTNDSSSFIESAESFLAGEGFTKTPRSVERLESDAVPLQSFPIGYPILIAGVSALGLEEKTAAVWIAKLSWILIPCVLIFTLRYLVGDRIAIMIAMVVSISPGMLNHGSKAISDVPYLLFTLGSVGTLFRSFNLEVSHSDAEVRKWLILSGALAGFAFLTRNVGVALIVAVCGAMVVAWLFRVLDPRELALRFCYWFIGLAPVITIQVTRNLITFGMVNPYHSGSEMWPPQTSLEGNIKDYLGSLLYELTNSWRLYEIAQTHVLLVAGMFLVVITVATFWVRGRWQHIDITRKMTVLVLAAYAFAISAVTIVGATAYSIEKIGHRFSIQYSWAVLSLVTVAIMYSSVWRHIGARIVVIGAFIVVGAVHMTHAVTYLGREPDWNRMLADDTWLLKAVNDIPTDAVIFSNQGAFLIIETGRKVRHQNIRNLTELNQSLKAIDERSRLRHSPRPAYFVVLQPKSSLRKSVLRMEEHDDVHQTFKVVGTSDHAVFLRSSW